MKSLNFRYLGLIWDNRIIMTLIYNDIYNRIEWDHRYPLSLWSKFKESCMCMYE